jgi:hypothetical protein
MSQFRIYFVPTRGDEHKGFVGRAGHGRVVLRGADVEQDHGPGCRTVCDGRERCSREASSESAGTAAMGAVRPPGCLTWVVTVIG